MPSVVSAGTYSEGAATVVTPTALAPGLPATRSNGHWMFCVTQAGSATATVATPTSWQSIYNVVGTHGRLALFVRKVDGSETAPTVTWSGLTTGATGTPTYARIINMGSGFYDIAGTLQVDVIGAVSDQAASATVMAGGAAITTLTDGAYVFSQGLFRDDVLTGISDAGTGITWAGILADAVTTGSDMLIGWSWGTKTPVGEVGAHTWTLTGATAFPSSGVMVAFPPEPPPVDTVPAPLTLTRSPIRMRG